MCSLEGIQDSAAVLGHPFLPLHHILMNLPNAASSTCLQKSWQRMTGHPSITIRAVALSLTSEKVPDFFRSPDLFEPSARNTPPVSWGLEKVVSGDRKYNAVVWCDMRWKQPNFRNPEHQKGTTDATFLPNYSMGEERYLRKILSAVMPLITCIFLLQFILKLIKRPFFSTWQKRLRNSLISKPSKSHSILS